VSLRPLLGLAVAATTGLSLPAAAPAPDQPSPVLITGRELGLVAGATAATALVSRFDVAVARTFGDSGVVGRRRRAALARLYRDEHWTSDIV
jgi:hypothetical protein